MATSTDSLRPELRSFLDNVPSGCRVLVVGPAEVTGLKHLKPVIDGFDWVDGIFKENIPVTIGVQKYGLVLTLYSTSGAALANIRNTCRQNAVLIAPMALTTNETQRALRYLAECRSEAVLQEPKACAAGNNGNGQRAASAATNAGGNGPDGGVSPRAGSVLVVPAPVAPTVDSAVKEETVSERIRRHLDAFQRSYKEGEDLYLHVVELVERNEALVARNAALEADADTVSGKVAEIDSLRRTLAEERARSSALETKIAEIGAERDRLADLVRRVQAITPDPVKT